MTLDSSIQSRFEPRLDYHQSHAYRILMEKTGWSSIHIHDSILFFKQVGPVSFGKMQRPQIIDIQALQQIKKKFRMVQLFIEPALQTTFWSAGSSTLQTYDIQREQQYIDFCTSIGLRVTSNHHAHSKTALIDIRPTQEHMLASFPSKTRYNVKLSQRKDIEYSCLRFTDLSSLEKNQVLSLQHLWSKEKHVAGYDDGFLAAILDAFMNQGVLIQAKYQDKLVGAIFLLHVDHTAVYFNACSDKEYRLWQVPTGIVWYALQQAKKRGCDVFDFCSLFDERFPADNPKWRGFTTFKQRFCPIELSYPPSFVL